MKKIILSVLSVLMIFGLIGCSGDLHDVVRIDPNAMEGNWFYTVIDVSSIEGTIDIIFSEGTNQTDDIKGVDVSSGSVAYIWSNTSKSAEVSTRTDCPDKSALAGDGEIVVYCFSNAAKVNLWAWDSADTDNNLTGGVWPGVVMDTDAVIPMVDVVIEGATVTANGLPDALNGTTLYFTGSFNGWKNPGEEGTVEGTVTDGSITITLPKLETQVLAGDAEEIIVEGKFAGEGWAPAIAGAYEEGAFGWDVANIKIAVTSAKKSIVGTFVETPADGKYVCTWDVE